MKSVSRLLIVVSFLLSFSEISNAQNNGSVQTGDTMVALPIDEVVITANRFSSIRINTPESVMVLGKKSVLHHQLRTAPEAFILTPGVFIQKTNHGGGSLFLRGLTGNQILLLIDGIRLSNATVRTGPNQYLNTIDVFSIERMEVLHGGGSVQYGSDAIGGTVQAFTHELVTSDVSAWSGSIYSRVATHGMEQSMHANLNYSTSNSALRGGVTWRNFGDIVGGDTTGRQNPSGYREFDYYLKGKILLTPSTGVTVLLQNVNQSDIPVYHKVKLENYAVNKMDPQKRQLGYIRINHELDAGVLKSINLTASGHLTEEGRESRKNGSSAIRFENDKVRSFSLTSEAFTSNDDTWSAGSGLELVNDIVKSKRTDYDLSTTSSVAKRGLYPDGASMTSIAAFSNHRFDLSAWNFTAGARFNMFIINVEDESTGKTRLTPSALVGNIGVLRKLNDRSNLFFSMTSGFRAPNIDDLGTLGIVDFRYETPNFDLRPEHSLNYQFGYKFKDRKIRGEFYIYRNELYNLIVRLRIDGDTIEGYPVYLKENSERAYIQGFETAWEYSPARDWLITGNLTYTYGQNKTVNEPVRRIPPIFGGITVEYDLESWWINLQWLAAGKQGRLAQGDMDDNRIPAGGTPGWNILNISSGVVSGIFEVDLTLQNLFDKDYRFHGSGINGYGRSALLSLILNFSTKEE